MDIALNELDSYIKNAIIHDFPFAVWVKDAHGRYLTANKQMLEYLGADSPSELLGKTIHDFFEPGIANAISAEVDAVVNTGAPVHSEKEYPVKGGMRWFDVYQSPLTAGSEVVGVIGYAWDITERKLAEHSLAESEERYRRVVEVSPEAIFIHCNGSFVYLNQAAGEMLGASKPEDLYGRRALDFVRPEIQDVVAKRIESATSHNDNPLIEEELVRLDGSIVYVEMVSVYLSYNGKDSVLAIARDITERKKMQDALVKTQKLESLGVLAGGIAHDFNNVLMAIIGNADLALHKVNPESPVIDNLRRIEQAALKAADLAKQMLAYSGKGKFVIEKLNLNRLLEDMTHMLEVSISKKAVLRMHQYSDLPSVEGDATQLRQVMMNLILNASEAIGDKSGVITITTGCMDCDANYLRDVWLIENIREGLYVYLEVADTGHGMDKNTLEKIFEPFFTTKFTGRGLGLAATIGIIRGHKGAIKVYSELNKGTTFKILLPASHKPAEVFNHVSEHDGWKGCGTVLLVDDEETVRGVGKEMLQDLGFSVVTASDGREAVDLFKASPNITVVVLDLIMPHLDGEQCFRKLRQIDNDVKVILSSGYNEHEVNQKFLGKKLAGFIQKPYDLSTLRSVLKKALDTK